MGYTTYFGGAMYIEPPLNQAEINYLNKFAATRRMDRSNGAYYVDGGGFAGQDHEDGIVDYNAPPEGQPGLWCQWVPSDDGSYIEWDSGEKFYNADDWLKYLIEHFLKPDAHAKYSGDTQFTEFTFDHICNGVIYAQGEDSDDMWRIVIVDNELTVQQAKVVYE